jgi:tRNA(fMet)-specific endonuclease VapC
MNGRFLLDTNIIIALFANDISVKTNIEKAEEVFIPSIAVGELYYGALKSTKVESNMSRIDEFVKNNTILHCESETARQYGQIKNLLRQKGKPLPENDIWIASISKQHSLTLVSRDGHFKEIENLQIQNW